MFTTGTAQRRGLQGAIKGISAQNAASSTAGIARSVEMKDQIEIQAAKRYRMATVGSTNSKGLIIQGKFEPDATMASDIEDYQQDYPVRYSGIGCLKFETPVRMPFIDGNVHVNGIVTDQTPIVPPPVEGAVTDVSALIEIGNGANYFTKDAATKAYYFEDKLDGFLIIDYRWTSKGSAVGGLSILGIPSRILAGLQTEGKLITSSMHPLQVTADVVARCSTNLDTITLQEISASSGTEDSLDASRVDDSGSFTLQFTFLIAE